MSNPIQFEALASFIHVDTRNAVHGYETGLHYTVTNDELAANVAKWIDEGKVEIVSKEVAESRRVMVDGDGHVI